MTDHPITPPPELVQQWIAEIWHEGTPVQVAQSDLHLATRAAQWGYDQRGEVNEAKLQQARDQEMEACCEWLDREGWSGESRQLRAARRPMTEQKSTSMMINCHWDGPPPSPHASVSDWFEQEGSKGVLHGLRISPLPSRGGNRSPKPPSLKEQALRAAHIEVDPQGKNGSLIIRALEALPND